MGNSAKFLSRQGELPAGVRRSFKVFREDREIEMVTLSRTETVTKLWEKKRGTG